MACNIAAEEFLHRIRDAVAGFSRAEDFDDAVAAVIEFGRFDTPCNTM